MPGPRLPATDRSNARWRWTLACTGVVAAVAGSGWWLHGPDARPRPTAAPVTVEVRADVRVEAGPGRLALWVPLPASDESQELLVEQLRVRIEGAALGFELTRDEHGNRFVYVQGPIDGPLTLSYDAPVRRHSRGAAETRAVRQAIARTAGRLRDGAIRFPYGGDAAAALAALRIDAPVDRAGLAARVLDRLLAGVSVGATPLERAVLLNELLRRNGRYLKTGAYGRGSSLWFCLTGQGNCTDFHLTYLDVARRARLAGRFRIGIPLSPEPDRPVPEQGRVPGYHCWVYLESPIGFAIDPSWEARLGAPSGTYFGRPLNDRVRLTEGTELRLAPPIAGPPLPFLFEAYAELDGNPLPRSYAAEAGARPAAPGAVTSYTFRRIR